MANKTALTIFVTCVVCMALTMIISAIIISQVDRIEARDNFTVFPANSDCQYLNSSACRDSCSCGLCYLFPNNEYQCLPCLYYDLKQVNSHCRGQWIEKSGMARKCKSDHRSQATIIGWFLGLMAGMAAAFISCLGVCIKSIIGDSHRKDTYERM